MQCKEQSLERKSIWQYRADLQTPQLSYLTVQKGGWQSNNSEVGKYQMWGHFTVNLFYQMNSADDQGVMHVGFMDAIYSTEIHKGPQCRAAAYQDIPLH
jgi:hypothetical protein